MKRWIRVTPIWTFINIVILVPLLAFIAETWWEHYQAPPVLDEMFTERKTNEYRFLDQYSQVVTPADWKGKVMVIDFFFTSCPTICPKMTHSMEEIQQKFGNKISLASLTVDPAHDSPAKLRDYILRRNITDENWQFLTGDKKDIYRLARKECKLVAADGDGGPADFIHSNKLILMDARFRIRGYYDGTSTAELADLEKDIDNLLKQRRP